MTLSASTIGPNVSIGAGSRVEDSTLRDTIIGDGRDGHRLDARSSR